MDYITCLGVHISPTLSNLCELNYKPLLENICVISHHHTWFGKAAIVKMNLSSKCLYLFQTIPLRLPKSFFAALKSALIRYILKGKKSRLNYQIHARAKEQGGIALPDIELYYKVSHLAHILDWYDKYQFR